MGTIKQLIFVGTLLLIHGGHSKIIKPASSGELQNALDQAAPGDTIQMLPMNYVGDFVCSSNGPITLVGDGNTTIESESIGMHIKGSEWNLKSFEIKGPLQGILIEGNKNLLEGLVLQKCGKAMIVKGEENKIKSCVISEAELGIVLDGSRNNLHFNSINIQNPAIVISPESCCGYLEANVANGEVHLDGNMYRLEGNVANHGLYVKGCNNEFTGNVANGASFPKECEVIDKGGNVYRGLGPGDTDLPNPNQPQQDQQQQGYYNQQAGSAPAYTGGFGGFAPNFGLSGQSVIPAQHQPTGAAPQSQGNYNQPQGQSGYGGAAINSGSGGQSGSVPQAQPNYNQPQGGLSGYGGSASSSGSGGQKAAPVQHQPNSNPAASQLQATYNQPQGGSGTYNQPQGGSGQGHSSGFGSSGQNGVPVQWNGSGKAPNCACTCSN